MSYEGVLKEFARTLSEVSKTSYDFGKSKGHFITEGQFKILVKSCAALGGQIDFVPDSPIVTVDHRLLQADIAEAETRLVSLIQESLPLRGEDKVKNNLEQGKVRSEIARLKRLV